MAETKKEPKKFIEFYLTELLNHVKNTSEHRFQPAEFSAIKKILVYLLHSVNPVEQIETLQRVPVLKPLHDFFTKVVGRFEDPAYRKSQMMASIEVDSEKLIHLFVDIFQSLEHRRDLTNQLPSLGITLQYKLVKDKLVKEEPIATAEPKLTTVKESPVPVVPAVKETQEFRRVGDMLGFLTRRVKKTLTQTEEVPVPEITTPVVKTSVLAELKRILRKDLHEALKALEQVQLNPRRSNYIIELADAVGSMKKTFRLHEAPALYEIFRKIEKTLNDVADRVDEKVTTVGEPAQVALNHIFHTALEWTDSPDTVTTEGLETAIHSSVEDFHTHLAPVFPKPKTSIPASVTENESPLNEIRIDPKQIDEGNFIIFRDESRYYLNSIDTILSHFEDTDTTLAIKEIEQSIRAINTAARMLRLQYVTDLCGAYLRSLDVIQQKSLPVPPDWIRQYQAAQLYFHDLLGMKPIPLTDWQKMLARLADTEKNIQQILDRSHISPTTVSASEPAEMQVPSAVPSEPETWMDAVQSVLVSFFNGGRIIQTVPDDKRKEKTVLSPDIKLSVTEPEKIKTEIPVPETIKEPTSAKEKTKETERTEEIVLPDLKPVEADTSRKRPPLRDRKEKTETPPGDEVDLLAIMVDPQSDFSKIRVPLFIDRMNTEPQDISEISKDFIRKIFKEHLRTQTLPVSREKPKPKEIPDLSKTERSQPEQLTTRLQRILMIESKFKEVDAELFEVFNQESESYFRLFDKALKRLQANLRDDAAVKDIERASHSIKSSARMLGFNKISGLAACIEMMTERYFDKEIHLDDTILRLFEDIVATLKQLYKSESVDITAIAERLEAIETQFAMPRLFTRYLVDETNRDLTQTKTEADQKKTQPVTDTRKPQTYTEEKKPDPILSVTEDKIDVDPEIMDIFKEEAISHFTFFENAIQRLLTGGEVSGCYRDIEKAAHSLKSSSRMVGLNTLAELARSLETLAEKVSKNPSLHRPGTIGLLQEAVQMLKTLASGKKISIADLLQRLNRPDEPSETISATESRPVQIEPSTANVTKETTRKVRKQKSTPKQKVVPFSDIDMEHDPILRYKLNQEKNLLDEMSNVSHENQM